MRRLIVAALGVVGLLTTLGPSRAENRIALVIGNGAYKEAPALPNPPNDARAVIDTLKRLNFDVVAGTDLDIDDMRQAIRDFSRKLEGSDVALFYYAGHGMQVYGKNYLVPIDAKLSGEADLDFAAVDVDLVVKQMERQPRVKLVILDACRDNPLSKTLARSMGKTRSAEALAPGLAKINSGAGTLIAFSTEPGAVALDGDEEHSPFTRSLLKHLETPDAEIQVVMTRVRGDVFKTTQEQQLPWVNTSLTGEFYLNPKPAAPVQAEPADKPVQVAIRSAFDEREVELALWRSVETSREPADYKEYLRQYPQGRFAGLAKLKIERLDKAKEPAQVTQPAQAAPPAQQAERSINPAEGGEQALGLTQARRAELQQRLTVLGYATGGTDGSFGPRTRKAIAAWQDSRKLASTGYLTQSDHDVLMRESQPALDRQRAQVAARRAAEQQQARTTPGDADVAPTQSSSPYPYAAQPAQPAPPAYAPPPQAYAPPPQAYAPPPQAYAPPPQAYAPPPPAYTPPPPEPSVGVGIGIGIGRGGGMLGIFGR